MTGAEYSYVLQPRRIASDGSVMSMDLMIINSYSHEHPELTAVIDWQDGLTIWQSEDLEPTDWMRVAEQIDLALKEARAIIGEDWIHGEFSPERL